MRGGVVGGGVSGVHIDERAVNCWRHCCLYIEMSVCYCFLRISCSHLYYRPISLRIRFTKEFKKAFQTAVMERY